MNYFDEQVRYKPKASEVEVDLSIDMNSDNFNSNANEHFKITKQVGVLLLVT